MSRKLFSSQSDSEDETPSSSFVNVEESEVSQTSSTLQAPKISFGFSKQLKPKVLHISQSTPNQIGSLAIENESEITHIENGLING